MEYGRGHHPNSATALRNATRKYEVNGGYFLDETPESAYYAGFLAADGCVTFPRKQISWSVARKDEGVLLEFLKDSQATYPVRRYDSKGYPQSNVTITAPELVGSLEDMYNITPRKSLTLQPPRISNDTNRMAFLKGFVDGDGCIGVSEGTKLRISVVGGSQDMIRFVSEEWSSVLGGRRVSLRVMGKNRKNPLWVTDVSDKKARDLFLIYDALPKGMSRKWSPSVRDLCENWEFRNGKYLRHIPRYEQIYLLEREGLAKRDIASRLGCTPENIYATVLGKNYRHFKETKVLDSGKAEAE